MLIKSRKIILLSTIYYLLSTIISGCAAVPATATSRTGQRISPALKRKERIEKKAALKDIAGLPIKNVIIDPGHGGKDPGAVSRGGLKEKDVVLSISRRLKDKLNACGINVTLTRDSDKFISLARRCEIANSKISAEEGYFFVSIHANAAHSRWASGVEVFYLAESIDDNLRSVKAAREYELNLKEGYSGKDTPAIIWDLILSDDRKSSAALAEFISCSLSRDLAQKNRGVKSARFFVLKSNIPAVLVEVGFISNLRDEKKLRSISYRDKIAQSICDAIVQYNRSITQQHYTRN